MRNYWQLEVIKNIEKYVNKCNMYQRMKNQTEIPIGKLMTNEVPESCGHI